MALLINYQALLDHLNPTCFAALDAGASLAISRAHAEIELDHFFYKLLEDSTSDVTHILRSLGVAVTPILGVLQRSIESKPAASQRPEVSPYIGHWLQDAWLLGSLEYGAERIRSAILLGVLLRGPERYRAERIPGFLETLRG